jgi:hypothetical protein
MAASLQVPRVEKKEIVTIDHYGARDIIDALESLAHRAQCIRSPGVDCPGFRYESYGVEFNADKLTLYLTGFWAITLRRSGEIIIEGGDAMLTVDSGFVLHTAEGKVVESERITWNGTEEVYTPSELKKIIRERVKAVLSLMGWL